MKATGTKKEVWGGEAKHTSGGLTKGDLMKNKNGKVVSKKKHEQAKKRWASNPLSKQVPVKSVTCKKVVME